MTTADIPGWLQVIATASLVLAIGCAVWVALDVRRRPPTMAVMAFVWPLTMLFGSVIWLWLYLRQGRAVPRGQDDDRPEHSTPVAVAVGASHCGAGCMVGDLVGELTLALVPAFGVVVGYSWLWPDRLFAAWTLDFVVAYVVGVAFQYFAIAPMRDLGLRAGLRAAVVADTLSITSWQIGMYGVMAIGQLIVLPAAFGGRVDALTPTFWLMMQLAMMVGFLTAYPVNWVLLARGVKERM